MASFRDIRSISMTVLLMVAGGTTTMASGGEGLADLTRLAQESTDVEFQRNILRGVKAALAGRPSAAAPAGWGDVEAALARSTDSEVRTLAQFLGLTFGSSTARSALQALAGDRQAPAADRNQALTALLRARSPNLAGLLQALCDDAAVRATALRGLAQFDDPQTPVVLLQGYAGWPGDHQRDAINTLASRPTYAAALLEAVGANKIPRSDLSAELVRQLQNHKNPELNRRLTEVWGVMKERNADMTAEIEATKRRYWAGGSQPGDARRGRLVFNQICAPCHHLFDFGGEVGPDITGANRSDLDYLLQNILYPNAVVPNEYRQSIIETKDGRVLTGILKSSEGAAYRLQTATELVVLPKAEVAKVELLETSMMPEGLISGLQDVQMRDLLYYLTRPGQVPLPAGN